MIISDWDNKEKRVKMSNLINNKFNGVVKPNMLLLKKMMGLTNGLDDKPRKVNKDGSLNIMFRQVTWSNPFVLDNAVYLWWIDIVWMLIFGFLSCWLGFGLVYYIIEYFNGTLCEIGPAEGCEISGNQKDIDELRCVTGLYDYSAAIQFSLETMTTVGYGARALRSGHIRCIVTVFTVIIQSMTGLVLVGLFTGIIWAKFKHSAPNKNIVSFSPEATITMRKGKLNLEIEVFSKKRVFDATVEGWLLDNSDSNEITRGCMKYISFGMENSQHVNESFVHVMWPVSVCHVIDNTSPFYKYTPQTFAEQDFELIVMLQGKTEIGGSILIKTSYIKSEIVWGGTFSCDNVLHLRQTSNITFVHEASCHNIDNHNLTQLSAYQLDQLEEDNEEKR